MPTPDEIDDLLLLYRDAPDALTAGQREYVRRLIASAGELYPGEDDPAQWTRRYYPDTFTRPFTRYQAEFWQWGFGVEMETTPRPRVECHPRGVGKSTGAETLVVRWLAKRRMSYVLYVSATDDQARKHLTAIKKKLEAAALLADYPHLAPRVEKYRKANSNWSGERLVTAAGQVVEAVSLLGNMRGFKTDEDSRIDAIILDDIDSSKDSPHIVEKKLQVLREEILPAGNDRTVVLFPQNLIHRDSICSQVLDHRADLLARRHFSGPFPLMRRYEAEKVELPDGSREWKIIDGESFDPAIDRAYCQSLLNQFGRATFDRECQQDVTAVEEDKDFREWDEVYHVVAWAEVAAGFAPYRVNLANPEGYALPYRLPHQWNVGLGWDWGTTKAHPSAVPFVARPDEGSPYDDAHFVVAEVCMPHFPFDPHTTAEVVSPGRVAAAVKRKLAALGVIEGQVKEAKMSHEASAARNTLMEDLPEELKMFFDKWKASVGSGVAQLQNLLEIDRTRAHPFRKYPVGHPQAGEPLMGRPRIYFVVEDGQGELYVDGDGRVRVRGAKDSWGLARARFEMPIYSQYNQGQRKVDDDFVDSLRGLMATFGVESERMTREQRRVSNLPEELKPHNVIGRLGEPDFVERYYAQRHELWRLRREEEQEAERLRKGWARAQGRPLQHGR